MRWLDNITYSMDMNLSKLQEILKDRGAWLTAVRGAGRRRGAVTKSRHNLVTEQEQPWNFRKMVLMNLSVRQQQRCRHTEQS